MLRVLAMTVALATLVTLASAQLQNTKPPTPGTNGGCYLNTSLGFVVDTSQSTDIVASTMQAALAQVGDMNGAVLSFQNYYLSTWNFMAADVKSFSTIENLDTFFQSSGIGNLRVGVEPPPAHDDWAYMLQSLYAQVQLASDYGKIVVLGDQDELCDGRPYDGDKALGTCWYCGRFDNTPYDALIPLIQQIAQAKHVTISFYYFITTPWNNDPNGCPPSGQFSREISMSAVTNLSTATGGVAQFSGDLSGDMADEVKQAGKVAAVCPGCAADSTLAIVVDTSGDPTVTEAEVAAILWKLQAAQLGGMLKPFNHYLAMSWATPVPTVLTFPTFPALKAALTTGPFSFYSDQMSMNDPNSAQQGNDWLYMINNLKEMVTHVGVGGYIVVIDDEEAFCDPAKFNGDPLGSKLWALELQQFINAAVAKKVQLSWYQFANGYASPSDVATCSTPAAQALIHLAQGRADATALILAGESILGIPLIPADPSPWPLPPAVTSIALSVVKQSQRASCSNCTRNATLAFVVDTSDSSIPLKEHHYKKWFNTIGGMAVPLASFTGGFDLNTWEQTFADILHYGSVAALNAYVQGAQLLANRVGFDVPQHDHDDWRYMIENLPLTVAAVGKGGIVIVIADDNQICDAGKFAHNSSDTNFAHAIEWAQQNGVAISYFQFATENRWCDDTQMGAGHALATQLASQTGGTYYFGSNFSATAVDAEFEEHVVPVLVAAGARPVCPDTCPPGSVWAGNGVGCIPIDPCSPQPCKNGGTCFGERMSTHYRCECPAPVYGQHCEFPCVPHSYPNELTHALGLVVDTSDSTGYALTGVAAAIANMLALNGSFDQYLLSTWAYVAPAVPTLVKTFATATQLQTELAAVAALPNQNKRMDADYGTLAQHDDWRYMLNSVDPMLAAMGDDGVLLVLTDLEGICDACESARVFNGIVRYPGNPQLARVIGENTYAKAHHIKVFFVTFPSSDANFGYCNATQKMDGYGAAQQMVDATDGVVTTLPAFNSAANAAIVAAVLKDIVQDQSLVKRCECEQGFHYNAWKKMCVKN